MNIRRNKQNDECEEKEDDNKKKCADQWKSVKSIIREARIEKLGRF